MIEPFLQGFVVGTMFVMFLVYAYLSYLTWVKNGNVPLGIFCIIVSQIFLQLFLHTLNRL